MTPSRFTGWHPRPTSCCKRLPALLRGHGQTGWHPPKSPTVSVLWWLPTPSALNSFGSSNERGCSADVPSLLGASAPSEGCLAVLFRRSVCAKAKVACPLRLGRPAKIFESSGEG